MDITAPVYVAQKKVFVAGICNVHVQALMHLLGDHG